MSKKAFDKIAAGLTEAIAISSNHLATGQHLLIDASGVNHKIKIGVAVESFFGDLVEVLEMERLGPLIIELVDEPCNKGWSATQMITTSHISFHADEIGMGFYLDIFSCRPFDDAKVLTLVREIFGPKRMDYQTVQRAIS